MVNNNISLMMVPSGINVGKLYSVLPEDGSGDFTVERNSIATYVGQDGLIKTAQPNVPRIDWSTGEAVLLVEPQATNYNNIQDLNDASWYKNDVTITPGFLAPDGTNTAHKVTYSGTSTPNNLYRRVDKEFLYKSFYIRTVTGVGTVNNQRYGTFNISEQWTRIKVHYTGNSIFFHLFDFNSNTSVTEYIVWGLQAEDYVFSSFIPTNGTTVTRLEDKIGGAGDVTTFNSLEGVLFVDMAALSNDLTFRHLSISDGSITNRIIFRYTNVSNTIQVLTFTALGASTSLKYISPDITQFSKIAVKWRNNDWGLYVDGILRDTSLDTPTFNANTLNVLKLYGSDSNSLYKFHSKIKQLKVFKTALTDAQLIALTTL